MFTSMRAGDSLGRMEVSMFEDEDVTTIYEVVLNNEGFAIGLPIGCFPTGGALPAGAARKRCASSGSKRSGRTYVWRACAKRREDCV